MTSKREQARLLLEEADAEEELVAAKEAYRADPTPDTLTALTAAKLRVRALHNQTRADRPAGIGG